jgi:putative Holliday junction resolvase
MAEEILIESGMSREKRKRNVDKIAAALILQGYLDSLKFRIEKPNNS